MNRPEQPVSGLLPPTDGAGLWPEDAPDDVRAFLDQNPELRRDKDAVLDLAYDEYCRQVEAGETPDPAGFCARFPTFQSSLRRAIQAHDYLAANPELLAEKETIPWPIEGETFLGFRLLRELGRGSFARVFLAAEPELGDRLVAVKVSPHGGNEAQTLGRLDHPNVVKVYTVRKDEGSGLVAVCMPYLGGTTLEGVLATFTQGQPRRAAVILETARATVGPAVSGAEYQAPHPLLEGGSYAEGVCLLGAQLADALAFLHARAIYHRDLKPSNVLLCPDGRPMLLDFNLSADPQSGRERLGGTLPYMSPEQVLATFVPEQAAAPVDGRSDLFSLGVILFELLTGRQPFGDVPRGVPSAADCAALLARQRAGAPAVRGLCPQATQCLAGVIASCLAFERERRPRDAAAVAAALRRDLAPHRRALRRLLRHPRKLAAAGVLAVGLASGEMIYLAARPPYAERMLEEARQASAAGDKHKALDRAGAALDRAPDSAEGYFFRACEYQGRGDRGLALDDFAEADRLGMDGRAAAGLAYFQALSEHYEKAIESGERAVKKGFATAAVYNNMGFCQIQRMHYEKAEVSLRRAFALDPRLPAAHHNRLRLLKRDLRLKRERLPELPGLLRKALDGAPKSAELYQDAAGACAAAGTYDPAWDEVALSHLQKAIALGLVLTEADAGQPYYRLRSRLPSVVPSQVAAKPGRVRPTPRLIDPLAGAEPSS